MAWFRGHTHKVPNWVSSYVASEQFGGAPWEWESRPAIVLNRALAYLSARNRAEHLERQKAEMQAKARRR